MDTLHKQLVLNKREDWKYALWDNMTHCGDALTVEPDSYAGGFVLLRAIDGGESGFSWGRVSLECDCPADTMIRTYARASDTMFLNGMNADDYFAGLDKDDPGAAAAISAQFKPVGSSDDFYINMTGRYLWLMFAFVRVSCAPTLSAVRIHMAGDHMIDYLPAVYRDGDGFTKRFLSIFDSIFMDMEKKIYDLPARFDFESTDSDMLKSLAHWVGVDASELERATTISRIRTALPDYESMHTVEGVRRSVERLCGRRPMIIESAAVDPNSPGCPDSELYRRLYGENPYKFFILLDEDAFSSRNDMEEFIERMGELIPANTEFELVLLKRCVQLDWHTYLGVNSAVSNYVPVVIDESTTIHYDMMIGGN